MCRGGLVLTFRLVTSVHRPRYFLQWRLTKTNATIVLKWIFQMFTRLAFFKRQHGLPHFHPDSGFLCPHCDNSLHICHNVYKDPPCATNGVRRDAKAVFEEKSDSSHPGARHEHLFPSLLDALRGRLNAHHVFRRRKLPEKVFFNHTWNYHTI